MEIFRWVVLGLLAVLAAAQLLRESRAGQPKPLDVVVALAPALFCLVAFYLNHQNWMLLGTAFVGIGLVNELWAYHETRRRLRAGQPDAGKDLPDSLDWALVGLQVVVLGACLLYYVQVPDDWCIACVRDARL